MKQQTIAALLAGLALLISAVGAASAQDPTVPWWVIAGGGGPSGGAGESILLNDTLGQPIIGSSGGGAVDLDAGYWQQRYGPAAVTDLQASVATGPLLQLDWTVVTADTVGHTIAGVTYNVYRGQDTPYFTPGDTPYNPAPLADPTFTDTEATVLTSAAHSTYYVVVAVYNGLASAPSGHVGAFVFTLAPGG